ncbi:MAG: DUF4258 domain-containing protein [Chloroflexota bacterium]
MGEPQRVTMEAVRAAVAAGRWTLTRHAREQAGKRRVDSGDLVRAISEGELLESYPADPRGPSALLLGEAGEGRPLHAVCAFDPGGELLIITVYEPAPPRWLNARTRNGPREGAI